MHWKMDSRITQKVYLSHQNGTGKKRSTKKTPLVYHFEDRLSNSSSSSKNAKKVQNLRRDIKDWCPLDARNEIGDSKTWKSHWSFTSYNLTLNVFSSLGWGCFFGYYYNRWRWPFSIPSLWKLNLRWFLLILKWCKIYIFIN